MFLSLLEAEREGPTLRSAFPLCFRYRRERLPSDSARFSIARRGAITGRWAAGLPVFDPEAHRPVCGPDPEYRPGGYCSSGHG